MSGRLRLVVVLTIVAVIGTTGAHFAWQCISERNAAGDLLGCGVEVGYGVESEIEPSFLDWLHAWLGMPLSIVADGCSVEEDALRLVGGLKSLRYLSLRDQDVSDQGLQHLAGLSRLRNLRLDGTRVTAAGLGYLGPLRLEVLDLSRTDLGDEAMSALAGLGTLRTLKLSSTRVSNLGLASLSTLHKLESLDLSFTRVTEGGLNTLSALRRLRTLNLSGTSICGPGIAHLENLPGLTELVLHRSDIDDSSVAHLARAVHLQVIDLSDTNITSKGLIVIGRLPALRELRLENTETDDSGIGSIADLPRLETLQLAGTQISDGGLRHLANAHHLRRLDLSNTAVSDTGIVLLGHPKELSDMWLESTRVTDRSMTALAAFDKLKSLCLDRTGITSAGLARIACRRELEYISFRQTQVNIADATAILSSGVRWDFSARRSLGAHPDPLPGRAVEHVPSLVRKKTPVHRFPRPALVDFQTRARGVVAEPPKQRSAPGWLKGPVIDEAAFLPLRPLSLKPQYRLVGYEYGGGYGRMTWAVATGTEDRCPEFLSRSAEMFPEGRVPRPAPAVDDFLAAIQGDDSPWSYLCASILRQEGENLPRPSLSLTYWGDQEILTSNPALWGGSSARWAWRWYRLSPANWEPSVEFGEECVKVVFYTWKRFLGRECAIIQRHTHVYPRGDMRGKMDVTVMARAGNW